MHNPNDDLPTAGDRLGLTIDEVLPLMEAIPKWFEQGPWARVPRGWMRRARIGIPYRFVALDEPAERRLMVITSGRIEADGKRWVHASYSRPHRTPDWYDTRRVKDEFLGLERLAVAVLPPLSQWVSIHEHCLHLWHCVDGDPTPDFRRNGHI